MRRLLLKLCWLILLIAVLNLVFFGVFRVKAVPVLCRLSQAQAKTAASALISEAISDQVAEGKLDYGKIVFFEKDVEGRITALKTNMQEINRIKSSILKTINNQILNLDSSELGIPLGNILLPELLGGRGPLIPVKILAVRSSNARFVSHFSQAGINQTLHQLHLTVQVEGTVLVLGNVLSFSASNDVMVAETVIVGQVPNSFS